LLRNNPYCIAVPCVLRDPCGEYGAALAGAVENAPLGRATLHRLDANLGAHRR
jgi:hypothetical protein